MTRACFKNRRFAQGLKARSFLGPVRRPKGLLFHQPNYQFSRSPNLYQIPLSLPVILKTTAAAEASGGRRLKRKAAGTLPRMAASVS